MALPFSSYTTEINTNLLGQSFIWNGYKCLITDVNLEYARNVVLYAIIDRISTDIASLIPDTESTNKKLQRLLKNPNHYQTWFEFIRDLTARFELDNTVFVYSTLNEDKTINSMYVIPKKDISDIRVNPLTGEIEECKLTMYRGQQAQIVVYNQKYFDDRNTLWQLSAFNSQSRFRADFPNSKFLTVYNSLDYIKLATEYSNNYLSNGAKPSYAIIIESEDGYDARNLTEVEKDELRKSFSNIYGGSENAGKPIILEGGMKLQQLNSDIDKLNFDEGYESAITFCCMAAGIDPIMINYGKDGSTQYKDKEDIRRNHYNNKIIPLGKIIYGFLSKNIMFRYDIKNELTFNETLIPTIMKERFEVAEIANKTESLTTNEIRKILKYQEIKDGNEVYKSIGSMPISFVTKNAITRDMIGKEENIGGTNV